MTDLRKGRISFSSWVTAFCVMICISGLGLFLLVALYSDDVETLGYTDRDLHRLANRMLGFESQVPNFSPPEQFLFRLWGQEVGTLEQIRGWYQEFFDGSSDSLNQVYLGILNGENGRIKELQAQLTAWRLNNTTEPDITKFFGETLHQTYVRKSLVEQDYVGIQARLAEELPANWFYFQLAGRLANQAHDFGLRGSLEEQVSQSVEPYIWRWRALLALEFALVVLGVVGIIYVCVFSSRASSSESRAMMGEVPWSFGEGVAVLARGGALTILGFFIMMLVPGGIEFLDSWGLVLLYLPPMVLAYLFLCRPNGLGFREIFGTARVCKPLVNTLGIFFAIVSLGLLGEWAIMIAGEWLGYSVHWTEWFVAELVWGTPQTLLKTGLDFVILAPLCEELIFRGILYATLRAKYSVLVSVLGSALLFALAHGYGLLAFFAVLWSGCLWAWSYERTGSLIPGVLAHAVNNGLVVYSILAFFR